MSAEVVSILDVPHTELRGMLSRGAPVYVPVNPVEYHGPHLSLHNDHAVSVGLAKRLHARLADVTDGAPLLLASSLEAGVEPCPGPGTRATSFRDLRAMVVRAAEALVELGARRVVFMTFHGAPLHAWALHAGVLRVRSLGAQATQPFNLVLRALLDADFGDFEEAFETVPAGAERETLRAGVADDFHAGFFETSVALALAPETVSAVHTRLKPCPAIVPNAALARAAAVARALRQDVLSRELTFAAAGVGWMELRPFPGYTGRPHLASAAAGEVFVRAMLDRYDPSVRQVFSGGAPPPPIMPWIVPLTAGGALPATHVPREAIASPASLGV